MRRHVRHELHRQAELETGFLFVRMAGERIRHQVVAQLVGIVLVRRRGAGAGITGDAETHRRRGEQTLHRCDGKLHRRGVATGIADTALSAPMLARQFRQAVVPALVEAIVGGKIDDQGLRRGCLDGLDVGRRLAIGQRQYHHVGTLCRHSRRVEILVAQIACEDSAVLADALAVEFARGNESQFQRRMRRDQADQFRAGVTPCPDDADALLVHASTRVGSRCAQCTTQRSMASKSAPSPYQNARQRSWRTQPSACS